MYVKAHYEDEVRISEMIKYTDKCIMEREYSISCKKKIVFVCFQNLADGNPWIPNLSVIKHGSKNNKLPNKIWNPPPEGMWLVTVLANKKGLWVC